MKVLIVINSLGSGGAERSTEVLCDYLNKKGVTFEVLCLDRREIGVQNRMIARGYTINFIPKGNFIAQSNFIANWIRHGDFTIVHSILFRANLRTRFAKIKTEFVHLESLVNTTYSRERLLDKRVNQSALRFYKFLDKITAARFVDHFHSITETVKKHYGCELGLDYEKISVIPRGRKPLISCYGDKQKLPIKPLQLINVGRHEFQKGQIYLLKACKELKEEGKNIHLKIFGRDGAATAEMKQYIQENDLKAIVSLEGFKSNIPEYLLKSHLFIFPSLYEGLGGALIEAQSAGLPIACNDIAVLHEVVKEDVNSRFFNVHDVNSIKESILFFLENPDNLDKYGKASLLNYQRKFDEEINNERLYRLYQNIC
ncbi:glycosyltransferase family 4 protein [Christiangramia salexigens]|uniref:Glycosyltransferase n=1 Tax=Christiangramia salexigens TaxID=1913577 RepID=A0A1L3J2C9_9FLAO|nr:glycosyltransferase family 4 protein [Christiangramia salexigens]APG59273.1 hypothetical protein LPB144_02095 [Christiangramia salexigens]